MIRPHGVRLERVCLYVATRLRRIRSSCSVNNCLYFSWSIRGGIPARGSVSGVECSRLIVPNASYNLFQLNLHRSNRFQSYAPKLTYDWLIVVFVSSSDLPQAYFIQVK